MSYVSPNEWTGATWNPTPGWRNVNCGASAARPNASPCASFEERGGAYEESFKPRLVPEVPLPPLAWATPILHIAACKVLE